MEDLFNELNMPELYVLCPDQKSRFELLKARIELYPSTVGFSKELCKFIETHGIKVGSGLRKSSPISLSKEEKQMAKQEEPDYGLVGGLALSLGEIAARLSASGTVTINYADGDLTLADAAEEAPKAKGKAAKAPKEEPEEAPKKGKAKSAAKTPFTQEEFMEVYAAKDPDAIEEFLEGHDVDIEIEESPAATINAVRMKKAVFEKFGWK